MSFLASRRHQEGLKKSHTNLLFTVMFLQYFSVEWLLGVHFLSWHNDKLSPTNEIVFLWGLPCWSCVHPVVCKSRAMYFWWRLILYYHLLSNLVWWLIVGWLCFVIGYINCSRTWCWLDVVDIMQQWIHKCIKGVGGQFSNI